MEVKKTDVNQTIFFAIVTMIGSVGAESFVEQQRMSYMENQTNIMHQVQAYNEERAKEHCDLHPSVMCL
jgi:hypothetical protein